MHNNKVDYLHIAPPCGTASRAREKPISAALRAQGIPSPKPLRSESCPLGLPGLQGLDRARVESANAIYLWMVKLVLAADALGIWWSIEHPRRSLLWHIPAVYRLYAGSWQLHYQACMHGGGRDKWSTWISNVPELMQLALACSKDHSHLSWGASISEQGPAFATAEEAAYPDLLCNRVAVILTAKWALTKGGEIDTPRPNHLIAAQTEQQRKQMQSLVPEYAAVKTLVISADLFTTAPMSGKTLTQDWHGVLANSTLLRQSMKMGQDGTQSLLELAFGLPWTQEAFVKEALKCKHPADRLDALDEGLAQAICSLLTKDPVEIAKLRASRIKKWAARRDELRMEEERFHESMPPQVKKVLEGKSLLVMAEMLEELDYPDKDLINEIRQGFRITGMARPSNVFEKHIRRPTLEVEELRRTCRVLRHGTIARVRPSSSPGMDQAL